VAKKYVFNRLKYLKKSFSSLNYEIKIKGVDKGGMKFAKNISKFAISKVKIPILIIYFQREFDRKYFGMLGFLVENG